MDLDLKAYQYKRMLEERRGHNYQYPTPEQWQKLQELGYEIHYFGNRNDTSCEYQAKEAVEDYRAEDYYSRIICFACPNIIGAKYYTVIFRKK